MKTNNPPQTAAAFPPKNRWRRILLLSAATLMLGGLAAGAWFADRMALSFLTGQRRMPGQDWFGNRIRVDGPTPGYAFLGLSEPNQKPPGFRITRPADEGVEYGLQAGDIVLSVDGRVFQSSFRLISSLLADHLAGEQISVRALRGSRQLDLNIVLRPFYRSPADLGLSYEEVAFRSKSGFDLSGWYIPASSAQEERTLIFVHGAKASRFQALDSVLDWNRRGYSVLAMDLSGRGASSGDYVTYTQNERLDVLSMVQWLAEVRNVPANRTVIFGTSNGASTAVFAAAQLPQLAGLILDAPYSDLWAEALETLSAKGVPAALAPILACSVWLRSGVDIRSVRPLDAIQKVTAPTLLIHGDADTQVLPYHSEFLHRKRLESGLPSQLWVIPGGQHGFDGYPAGWCKRAIDFADRAIQIGSTQLVRR